MKEQRRFSPHPDQIPKARQFVLDALGPVPGSIRDDVSVMVSELATNAIVYSDTTFEVRIDLSSVSLRVEVEDFGFGEPLVDRFAPMSSLHGRGLMIVEHLSHAWGVQFAGSGLPGKSVWFSVQLQG